MRCLAFCYSMNPTHLGPLTGYKMVLLKDSFLRPNTARSQRMTFSKIQKWLTLLGVRDSAQFNTARSFGGEIFVFAGLSLPGLKMKI